MKKYKITLISGGLITGLFILNFSLPIFAKTVSDSVNVYIKTESLVMAPVIIADNVSITTGDSFDPLKHVQAYDSKDGDLTSSIKIIENTVNEKIPGVYRVVYEVTNSQGASTLKTIFVTVLDDNSNNNSNSTVKPQTGDTFFYETSIILSIAGLILINKKKKLYTSKV